MSKASYIVLILLILVWFNVYSQNNSLCSSTIPGVKTITRISENGPFGYKETIKDYLDDNGKLLKTELTYDSVFIKIDTFIYNDQQRLIRKESMDPDMRQTFATENFYYDKTNSNNRISYTQTSLEWLDSINLDTTYFHIQYDFIRDDKERFTERRTYYSQTKDAVFDTSKYELTYQHWLNDTTVQIEDHTDFHDQFLIEHYRDCRVIKIEVLNVDKDVIEWYDYEYLYLDKNGYWQTMHVYHTLNEQRTLFNTVKREVELY